VEVFFLKRTQDCKNQSFWYSFGVNEAQNEGIGSEMDETRQVLELSDGLQLEVGSRCFQGRDSQFVEKSMSLLKLLE
jgi:hypothetical protein